MVQVSVPVDNQYSPAQHFYYLSVCLSVLALLHLSSVGPNLVHGPATPLLTIVIILNVLVFYFPFVQTGHVLDGFFIILDGVVVVFLIEVNIAQVVINNAKYFEIPEHFENPNGHREINHRIRATIARFELESGGQQVV